MANLLHIFACGLKIQWSQVSLNKQKLAATLVATIGAATKCVMDVPTALCRIVSAFAERIPGYAYNEATNECHEFSIF